MSYVTKVFDSRVEALLNSGGIGFMPSDTIYGLSCRALDEEAVQRLHAIKGCSPGKPFIVLISDIKMLDLLVPHQNPSAVVGNRITEHRDFGAGLSEKDLSLLNQYWPGPLSIIFPARCSPNWLKYGLDTLAIRLPNHPDLCELISKTGPLISTSANPESAAPASSVKEAFDYFGDRLDFYVDAGELSAQPSTIAKLSAGHLQVIRQGAVRIEPEGV